MRDRKHNVRLSTVMIACHGMVESVSDGNATMRERVHSRGVSKNTRTIHGLGWTMGQGDPNISHFR